VTLRAPDFRLDLDRLRAAVTDRTRLILLNSPHNPTGTVLTETELAAVADLAVERDLVVVTDEVYEHMTYDVVHRPLKALPGQPWEAATRLAAKAFSASATLVEQFDDTENERNWSILAAPIMTADGPSTILTLRDVTDLAKLQRTLAHEQTMAALGGLVAGVAHEVRNPLFAISATLDAFEARFGEEPDFTRYVERLRPEVQRLSALMRDLLEYGRPPALQRLMADVQYVIREAVERSETATTARGIRVVVQAGQDATPVHHDPARLLQVVQNLLDNALVHAPEGSTITISLGPVEMGNASWYRIAIEDEGPGFKPEDIAHVFEPFYSRRRGGTGLGLSIVQRLVEQHGGKVIAENRAEGGACVTVLLPLT
jgi:signal transduction histidine kinase